MKTIQITMDEELLAKLDRDQETQRDGRSAVLRRAVAEYLKRRRHRDLGANSKAGKTRGNGRRNKAGRNLAVLLFTAGQAPSRSYPDPA